MCLVIGIGGGGDILGCLPMMFFLERLGVPVVLGSLTWERIEVSGKPGPRALDEIDGIVRISETVALAGPQTKTKSGVVFQASKLSKILGRGVILVDINKGVKGIIRGLKDLAKRVNIGAIIGIDVGGDVLAEGKEPGLQSPLADSMMLAALAQMDVPTIIGVFGVGCDGELTVDEALSRIEEVARMGGYLGAIGMLRDEYVIMKEALTIIETEASRLPVLVFDGNLGLKIIRRGRRYAHVSILSTLVFLLSPNVLYSISPLAQAVAHTESFMEAVEALHRLGIKTEYDYELEAVGHDQARKRYVD